MIKQFKTILFIGALLLTFMSSCKKEIVMEAPNESQTVSNELKTLVTKVRAWRDSLVSNKTIGSSENNIKSLSLSQNDIVPPVIDWDKAFKNFDTIGKKGISVPLSYDPISGNYLQFVTSLVKNKITGFIVRTLPDSAYHKIHRNRYDFSNFSGTIIVYDITGKYLNQVNFKKGDAIKANNNSTNKWGQIKIFEEEVLPEVVVIGHRKRSTSYLLIFLNNIKGVPNQEFDPNFDGGGVPVGGIDDGLLEIINEITDPCLKYLVNNLQNSDKLNNAIGAIMQSVFGKSAKLNLTFKQDNNLIGKKTLRAAYGESQQLSDINFEIRLNAKKLSEFSQERQTLTIMHEILHNYFFNAYGIINEPNGHTRMLNDYIEEMASSLENLFPNLKDHHDVTIALCFDNLWSSAGPEKEFEIDPFEFNNAISKYNSLGVNLNNWKSLAMDAKWNNSLKDGDSPLGTASDCIYK